MSFQLEVGEALAGKRIDLAVAALDARLSRAQVRRLIDSGAITVCGAKVKPAYRLRVGDTVDGRIPPPEPEVPEPQDIPLDVVYEDAHLIVIDKPAGLVVHPAAGHRTATLVHALLHRRTPLSGVGGVQRPGIVHRLDKGTSGLLVVAKTDAVHRALAAQFRAHSVDREYLALVRGNPGSERGSIDAPIGRHPRDRKRFSTRAARGRAAVTHWHVVERLRGGPSPLALLRTRLDTGRTHQIRVHLASAGLPVVGDPVYGGGRALSRALGLTRQALHAARLGFTHPVTGERLDFESPLPHDLAALLRRLRGEE